MLSDRFVVGVAILLIIGWRFRKRLKPLWAWSKAQYERFKREYGGNLYD